MIKRKDYAHEDKQKQIENSTSNKELASLAKVSPNTIVTAGKVDMQPVTIGRIAKALGVEVTEILEEN